MCSVDGALLSTYRTDDEDGKSGGVSNGEKIPETHLTKDPLFLLLTTFFSVFVRTVKTLLTDRNYIMLFFVADLWTRLVHLVLCSWSLGWELFSLEARH